MRRIKPSDFPFRAKIEDMPRAEVRKRIAKAMQWPMDRIETIPYAGGIPERISYRCAELTALCPMTGAPDFYEIAIVFVPGRLLPELKSLRAFLLGFRDLPITHEHLQAKIFRAFKAQVKPKRLRVELSVAMRGGIKTDIVSEA